jgi:zinc/manganese transport system permease protein
MINSLSIDFILPGGVPIDLLIFATCASLLVIATHVPLGIQVLDRGIIFIDLAIAQVAGLGAYLAVAALGEQIDPVWTQACAMVLALCVAWLFSLTEKLWPRYQEALIGVVFVLSATAVLLLLSSHPHGGNQLNELLSGQLLWVGQEKLLYSALATALLLFLMYLLRYRPKAFYGLFAVAITISVQLVGVYLVFATLIVPSLGAAACQDDRYKKWLAFSIALSGYLIGLILSAWLDLPSGPLIVWTLVMSALILGTFGRLCIKKRAQESTLNL